MGERARESSAAKRVRLMGTQTAPAYEMGVITNSIAHHAKT